MSYRFIENRYPTSDPNLDLNFGNDILYKEMTDDDYVTHNTRYQNKHIKPLINNKNGKLLNDRKKYTYNIYILFIVIVILLLVFWYVNRKNVNIKKNIIDTYISDSELILNPKY